MFPASHNSFQSEVNGSMLWLWFLGMSLRRFISLEAKLKTCKAPVGCRVKLELGFGASSWGPEISWNYSWYLDYRDLLPWRKWLLRRADSMALYLVKVPPLTKSHLFKYPSPYPEISQLGWQAEIRAYLGTSVGGQLQCMEKAVEVGKPCRNFSLQEESSQQCPLPWSMSFK